MGQQPTISSVSLLVLEAHNPSKSSILSLHSFPLGRWFKNPVLEEDLWWGISTLEVAYPCFFRIARFKDAEVVEVVSNGNGGLDWNIPFSRDLHEWEIPLVGNLTKDLQLVFLNPVQEDNRVWSPATNGVFSSKSFLSILTKVQSLSCNVSLSCFWKTMVPQGLLLYFLGKQNTREVIQRRLPFLCISPSMCPFYKRDEESGNHIFIHCAFSSEVWNFFKQALSLNFAMLESVESFLSMG